MAEKNEGKRGIPDKEKRELLLGDRRMALESFRDLAKWTAAALLAVNGGGAVVTLDKLDPAHAATIAVPGYFVLGSAYAVMAGIFGALAAYFAAVRADNQLGHRKPLRKWGEHIVTVGFWGCVVMVPYGLLMSFDSFRDAIMVQLQVAEERQKEHVQKAKDEATKKAGPSTSVLER